MAKWTKGMHVFLKRAAYGGDDRQIDYRYKFKIRSCGKKQAVLDRIYSPEEESRRSRYYGNKGNAHYLTDPEQIRSWREDHPGQPLPSYYNEMWSDIFCPAGDGDWDAEENYTWS